MRICWVSRIASRLIKAGRLLDKRLKDAHTQGNWFSTSSPLQGEGWDGGKNANLHGALHTHPSPPPSRGRECHVRYAALSCYSSSVRPGAACSPVPRSTAA